MVFEPYGDAGESNGVSRRDVSRTIGATRARFNAAVVLDTVTRWTAAWMVAAAVCVLALKVSGGLLGIQPWHVLATGAAVLAAAVAVAARRRYDEDAVAALLDLKGRHGGRVIAAAGGRGAAPPDVGVSASIRILPLAGRVAVPLVLVAASLVVPWSVRAGAGVDDEAIGRRARVVQHRIEKARRMGVIERERALELMERLSQAQRNAGVSPEAAAEAVDEVQSELDRGILEAAESGRTGRLAAQELADHAGSRGEASTQDLDETLAQALEGVAAEDLPPELRNALDDAAGRTPPSAGGEAGAGELDPETLKELGEALEKMQTRKLQDIGKASELVKDPSTKCAVCEMAGGPGDGEPSGEGPGQGGVTHGPGDALLAFGDETDTAGARFEPVPFEPGEGFLPSLVPGAKQGAGSVDAPQEFQPARSEFTAVQGEGGLDSGAPLSPYHDDVVSSYFQNEGSAQ
jgi:hypothetical protein